MNLQDLCARSGGHDTSQKASSRDRYVQPGRYCDMFLEQLTKSQSTAYSRLYEQVHKQQTTKHRLQDIFDSQSKTMLRDWTADGLKKNIALDKIWDAPNVIGDYLSQPMDWAPTGVISICLFNTIYLAYNDRVEIVRRGFNDKPLNCVRLHHKNYIGAVGTKTGVIQVFDIEKQTTIRSIKASQQNIGCLRWNSNILIAGGHDSVVSCLDLSARDPVIKKYQQHKDRVCSMAVQNDNLASGSSDKTIVVRQLRSQKHPLHIIGHEGTVKTLDWCPWKSGLLASGGKLDKSIICWNMNGKDPEIVCQKATGSPISSIFWHKKYKEILTSHDNPDNFVRFWRYPSLETSTTIEGHQGRIIQMCLSPHYDQLCTISTDETVRFWKLDQKPRKNPRCSLDRFIIK